MLTPLWFPCFLQTQILLGKSLHEVSGKYPKMTPISCWVHFQFSQNMFDSFLDFGLGMFGKHT